MELDELKTEVSKLLMSKYDFTVEEAEEKISGSLESYGSEGMWNDNADPEDLAKYLATEDDDV